jgi:hypothetical protein
MYIEKSARACLIGSQDYTTRSSCAGQDEGEDLAGTCASNKTRSIVGALLLNFPATKIVFSFDSWFRHNQSRKLALDLCADANAKNHHGMCPPPNPFLTPRSNLWSR